MITNIEQFVKVVKEGMKIAGIQRLTLGQQIVVKISLSDFINEFGQSTNSYKLGSSIRVDSNGITYCADDEKGITKEDEI